MAQITGSDSKLRLRLGLSACVALIGELLCAGIVWDLTGEFGLVGLTSLPLDYLMISLDTLGL